MNQGIILGILRTKKAFVTVCLALFSILLLGCEKDVEIDLIDEEPKLVVEATIENGQPPVVVLSRSVDFYAAISPQTLAGSFVRGADVFISNGTVTHQLKEYSTPVGSFNLVYYSIDSSSLSTAIIGQLNQQYNLRIVADGAEYTATTTIPDLTKRIDSIWWKPAPPQADSDQVIIMVRATDPPGFGDYIRYFTKRNNGPFLAPFTSTFDDLFIDGTTYELPLEPGIDRNRDITDRDRFFVKGDTLTFKLSNIDKATYEFWRTMEYSYASVGNPFATPIKVQSNISGNALGYFGGFASQYRTLIVPK
ncbi:MAG TPA: DUF4249 domain-containing protein [Flavisolibacter sp.]|jgi:hypothetical protein|nr:DUF4249 domain-containing protein [Flavisolibacter sp.]